MHRLFKCALALLAGLSSGAVQAQAWPTKPIRIVIPFVAGGSSDIVGRAIGSKFQEYLGQPAVVENRPGANGSIAAEFVAKSDADGYTILVGSIGVFSINAALFKDLRYHPVRDFAPITLAVTTPNVLVTRPDLPANSMKELVEFAKKNPGQAVVLFERHRLLGPPDRRAPQAGRGNLRRARAVPRRRRMPDRHHGQPGRFLVPEPRRRHQLHQGREDEGARGHGAVAPSAASQRAADRRGGLSGPDRHLLAGGRRADQDAARNRGKAQRAAVRALRSPDVRERMTAIGFDVVAGSAEEFGQFMKAEVDRWTRVVQRGGIQPD